MRLFIIMVTFDTPLYIRLFSMYFQIDQVLVHRIMCNSFPECCKNDFIPRKEMSQN